VVKETLQKYIRRRRPLPGKDAIVHAQWCAHGDKLKIAWETSFLQMTKKCVNQQSNSLEFVLLDMDKQQGMQSCVTVYCKWSNLLLKGHFLLAEGMASKTGSTAWHNHNIEW
jgi:hypothetical protein